MPWLPGSMPVMNVDHATGLCGGFEVSSGMKPPVAASRDKVRHDTFLHVLLEQLGIHPVDTEDHHARRGVRACRCAAGIEDRSEQREQFHVTGA